LLAFSVDDFEPIEDPAKRIVELAILLAIRRKIVLSANVVVKSSHKVEIKTPAGSVDVA